LSNQGSTVLRDRAWLVSADLKAKASDETKWDAIKARIKKATLGIGGGALMGLNASASAATVGITSVGSVVSAGWEARSCRVLRPILAKAVEQMDSKRADRAPTPMLLAANVHSTLFIWIINASIKRPITIP